MAGPDKAREEPDLTDGRAQGDWRSRYDASAWVQIVAELVYLAVLLLVVSAAILYAGMCITATPRNQTTLQIPLLGITIHREILQWCLVVLSGMVGGIVFDLKWLYHSVAKQMWSRDRVLWRIIVPFVSGIVSVFLAFIVLSGLIPLIRTEAFRTTYFALGFGFLFGYFSDNVIAALQNFAKTYIGVTKQD